MKPVYFCIDDHLLYNAFFHDFGPLHIGHLYRFAVLLHDILGDKENEGKAVVFWSKCDPRSRSNAATLLACYMVRRIPATFFLLSRDMRARDRFFRGSS